MKADQNVLGKMQVQGAVEIHPPASAISCPHCGKQGTFAPSSKGYGFRPRDTQINVSINPRVCPNPDCVRVVVFVTEGTKILALFPPARLDFNPQGVPEKVKECLEEAITCHASGAHRAAALMVRRTLEELCEDRSAKGSDLKKRIAALGTKVVMPQELFTVLDDLRLLGNDAAHVEARVYEDIGVEETEVAIELTKEVLKAAYQYANLVAKLRALKTTA